MGLKTFVFQEAPSNRLRLGGEFHRLRREDAKISGISDSKDVQFWQEKIDAMSLATVSFPRKIKHL